jgi:hypothetical protein
LSAPHLVAKPVSRFRLGLLLWLAGMVGVCAFSQLPLPGALAQPLPAPRWLIQAIGLVQSGLLLAAAVAIGVRLTPRVGLHAPAFAALAARGGVARALLPQLAPGAIGGILGASVLLAFRQRAPAAMATTAAAGFDPSLLVRVLYGGITEELLLRWGVMTLLLWASWRLVQRGAGAPQPAVVLFAVLASAFVFGLGHLPTVLAFGGALSRPVIAYVLLGNATFGCITGFLFWRYGLEAAMIAHALAHVFAHYV